MICTLPISIRLLIADYLPSQKSTTRWQITQLCLTILMFLNHSVRKHFEFLIENHLEILDQFYTLLFNWSSISE